MKVSNFTEPASGDDECRDEEKEKHEADRRDRRERLQAALRSFDSAAIFTIHGFCQRVLRERAFESGSSFESELVSDADGLLEEVAQP